VERTAFVTELKARLAADRGETKSVGRWGVWCSGEAGREELELSLEWERERLRLLGPRCILVHPVGPSLSLFTRIVLYALALFLLFLPCMYFLECQL